MAIGQVLVSSAWNVYWGHTSVTKLEENGVHPLITLFAMYAGFKVAGVFGLILGPIGLMILKCLFEPQLERGLFKDLFDEN